jgi:putative isomerase
VKRTRVRRLRVLTCIALLLSSAALAQNKEEVDWSAFVDVLDMQYRDCAADTARCSLFVDNGAWHAYALPNSGIGFVGPYLLTRDYGFWLPGRFGDLQLKDLVSGAELNSADAAIRRWSEPGRLRQIATWDKLRLELTLIFSDARTALLEVRLENLSTAPETFSVRMQGVAMYGPTIIQSADSSQIETTFSESAAIVVTEWIGEEATASAVDNAVALERQVVIAAGETRSFLLAQASYIDGEDRQAAASAASQRHPLAFSDNRVRWSNYVRRTFARLALDGGDEQFARLAVKSIQTLTSNWRGAAKDLKFDGVYPSYAVSGFNGVWSWDTWKQAVATAYFDSELAKNQVRGMFEYQNEQGMVADVIYYDQSENNWRDTKPPLSAWAVWAIYESSGDREFLLEMLPKLIAYHDWWYVDRDHDGDGLAEYGSTDGSRIAAAWESGMDNAVRFDGGTMLQNSTSAWSLDQESVDLNSYLYAEKHLLARIATTLDHPDLANRFESEATELQRKIQDRMFDTESGYFYDTSIDGTRMVIVQGPEGWSPLWTGVATEEQAERVIDVMLDENKFATLMPFPTLAADHPNFEPNGGYWRGPVWLDQAYFAVASLRRFGRDEEARLMTERLINNANGLLEQSPIYENYVPTTGEGIEAPHFSWSAAHYLMLLADY